MRYVKKLNQLLKQLDTDYNINCGGCCFVAAVVARKLEQYNIDYKFCVFDAYNNPGRIRCTINNAIENDEVTETYNHYFLKVNRTYINKRRNDYSSNIVCFDNIDSYDIFSLYDLGDWNSSFDVSYCDIIENKINDFFNTYYEKKV